jgi:hypothetical protein
VIANRRSLNRKRLDFTVIHQPWLRDAAKHWMLEELPLPWPNTLMSQTSLCCSASGVAPLDSASCSS